MNRWLKNGRNGGFTLLEVLIALAVLALSMAAVIKSVAEYTNNQTYLRDRTFAVWVARNVLVQFQTDNEWPDVGERKGTQEMGYSEWRWVGVISQTEDSDLKRMDVEVFHIDTEEDDAPLSVLSGFLVRPS